MLNFNYKHTRSHTDKNIHTHLKGNWFIIKKNMWERKGLERYENEKHILFCRSTIIKNGNRSTRMKIENQEQEKIKKKKDWNSPFSEERKRLELFRLRFKWHPQLRPSCLVAFSLLRGEWYGRECPSSKWAAKYIKKYELMPQQSAEASTRTYRHWRGDFGPSYCRRKQEISI